MHRGKVHPSLKYFLDSLKNYKIISREEAAKRMIKPEEVLQHNTLQDAWASYKGFVYNLTPYCKFHPGGVGSLTSYFGYDITKVTQGIHAFVNVEMFLSAVIVGTLDGEPLVPK
ncbi:Ferrihemoglobin_reductase [Hexamita inflata]|uniref:Ferrihemoglobin reductase n=1 Tax=Hexamita inflata TaxID=28002 RepID=A0AA86TC59_9EUKA|nr:Ferrihemoglobin reductase [Hexamita inflata]